MVCEDPETNLNRVVGMAALGPHFCGTDSISALFTNVLFYEKWIDNTIDAFNHHPQTKTFITGSKSRINSIHLYYIEFDWRFADENQNSVGVTK